MATYATSAIYDGSIPPSNSLLYVTEGVHSGSENASALTTGLNLTVDEYINLYAFNATKSTLATISGNTAGPNSVISGTLSSGDWDVDDEYLILAQISTPDIIYCEGVVSVVSGSVDIGWYIHDDSADTDSAVYTQTINGLTGLPDGNYNTALSVSGVITLSSEGVIYISSRELKQMSLPMGLGTTIRCGMIDDDD